MGIGNQLREWAERNVGAAESDDAVVVKTTRYLRLSMIVLVIGLAAAILTEYSKSHLKGGGSGHCWQPSISAYYYTPVQLVFVGALVAIGITLIVLKGSTELEDVFLNFAGILAPVVAFVPTPNVGECGSVLTDTANRGVNISNNVTALLIMAGVALAVLALLKWLDQPATSPPGLKAPKDEALAHRIAMLGYVAVGALYIAALALFLLNRPLFNAKAHWGAAITMFAFIILAVINNAINFYFTRKQVEAEQAANSTADGSKAAKPLNRYAVIAALMVATPFAVVPWAGDYKAIWLEAILITLFTAFWVIQTQELWNHGLRTPEGVLATLQEPQGAPRNDIPGPDHAP
ncbi:hypothetical protein [Streptomyces sp. NPDC005485]|uniref:hypothetical protein n=1 Tax=Streptomyces sp. NPDC005485 TaxID=3155591 RepID=UPI0033BC9F39